MDRPLATVLERNRRPGSLGGGGLVRFRHPIAHDSPTSSSPGSADLKGRPQAMERMPNAQNAWVSGEKLRSYLLAEEHPTVETEDSGPRLITAYP